VGRAGIYRFFGHAPVIATAWKLVRWPLLLAILLAVIAAVYRYPAPTRGVPGGSACPERRWRCCCGWPRPRCSAPTCWPEPEHRPDSAPRTRTASIGTVVWMCLSALAVLPGAQLNGELSRSWRNTPEAARSGRTGQPSDPTEQTGGV
jgi:hypothetical protein